MTTRHERTRTLHEMPQMLMRIVAEPSREERLQMLRIALRHYPTNVELNAIARHAPDWLEVTE